MKELFNILSGIYEFFKEKRLVFQFDAPHNSETPKPPVEAPKDNTRIIEVPEEMAGIIVGRAKDQGAKLTLENLMDNALQEESVDRIGREDEIDRVIAEGRPENAEKRAFEGLRVAEQGATEGGLRGISLAEDRTRTGNLAPTSSEVYTAVEKARSEAEKRAFEGLGKSGTEPEESGLRGLTLADEQKNIAKEVDNKAQRPSSAIAGEARRDN
jgi:hypothetical protein